MFKKILVPVDLSHKDALARAIIVAGSLAKASQAEIVFAGIYGSVPSSGAHFPDEFKAKLGEFAAEQAQNLGVSITALPVFSQDTTAELCSLILSTIDETGSDAVVMASHVPGWIEHVFHSNAGYFASHAKVSVFMVRNSEEPASL